MNLPMVNEDFELGGADSTMMDVDLSVLNQSCFVPVYSTSVKAGGKKVLTSLTITVTPATPIKTTLVDGAAVTFLSAVGAIQGSSSKGTTTKMSICLADDSISGPTSAAYTGDGSMGDLTVMGVNASSGAPVTDMCKVWFKKAGQDKAKTC